MWFPMYSHFAMDSVVDLGLSPIAVSTSLAAIVISAVSIPYGQKTAHLLHSEHW